MPRTVGSPLSARIVIDGRPYINFGGSSYLGLSGNARILEAGAAALQTTGAGYQLARHYQVATHAHQEVEAEGAAFFGTESAIYLAAGYHFGLVAMAAVRGRFTTVFFDELAHHCLREAVAASGLASHAFRHMDTSELRSGLNKHLRAGDRPLIVTDGMYSTFGEIPPLDEWARALEVYDGRLLIDESHSFGVLGARGRGSAEHHGVEDVCVLAGGSTSKAFGVVGGLIPATEEDVMSCRATPASRNASAGLPAAAAMCAASLRYVRQHPELLARLRANVTYMKSGLRGIGLEVGDSIAPVASFVPDPSRSMQELQQQLMARGIFVLHSNYIGAGTAGAIRCGIFADHTAEQMDALFEALRVLL